MLDTAIKAGLQAYLDKIVHPIELVATLDDSPKADEPRAVLRDIAGLSPRVRVVEDGDDSHRPSFSVSRVGEAARLSPRAPGGRGNPGQARCRRRLGPIPARSSATFVKYPG
jgi:alkyl hydroperoxide reductase subunit AhpF